MNKPVNPGRRAFLGLQSQTARSRTGQPGAVRPPWSTERSVAEHCTKCGACVEACPERILRLDGGGLPQVDFSVGGCTFCGDCAKSCTAKVFDLARAPAWPVKAVVSDRCLPRRGILCESCRDVCFDAAIRFERGAGRAPVPAIVDANCTGCGACLSVCPAGAISVVQDLPAPEREAAHG